MVRHLLGLPGLGRDPRGNAGEAFEKLYLLKREGDWENPSRPSGGALNSILWALCRCRRTSAKAGQTTVKIDPERLTAELFRNAFDYYIAGRYAVYAKLANRAGNLLHHAVEMSLKGALSKGGLNLSELENFRHDLKKLWKTFKKQTKHPALKRLDEAVTRLNRLEKLRYPNFMLTHGMQLHICIKKSHLAIASGKNQPPKFELCLEEVDEIFAAVFNSTGLNAKPLVLDRLSKEAKDTLAWENSWMIN
jgi:hypothetical protein